jgi:TonB family C-terminal domain
MAVWHIKIQSPFKTFQFLKMKKLFITIIVVIVSIFGIQAQEKMKIAVMNFTVGEGVDEAVAKGLSDALTKSLSKTGKFTIVEREQLYQAIVDMGVENPYSGVELLTYICKRLGVKSVLIGVINSDTTFDKYNFDISIINIERGKITYTTGVSRDKNKSSNKKYRKLVPKLAEKLLKKLERESVEILIGDSTENTFQIIETMPSFPGGEHALNQYLAKNIKYPVDAMISGIQGRVICQFVVNKEGLIVDIDVIRSVNPSLDKEAVRVIEGMPKWNPGIKNGEPINVRYTMPISFRMQ